MRPVRLASASSRDLVGACVAGCLFSSGRPARLRRLTGMFRKSEGQYPPQVL